MTLRKGFLSGTVKYDNQKKFQGFLIWIISAYIIYGFCYIYREVVRLLSVGYDGSLYFVFSEQEHFAYNFFIASLATSLGYLFALRFVLTREVYRTPCRSRLFLRQTISDIDFFTWTFLFFFGKISTVISLMYLMFSEALDLEILANFKLLLILLPLVIFLSSWPNLMRALGRNSFGWLGTVLLIFFAMVLLLSKTEIINFKTIDRYLLNNAIEFSYQLELPQTETSERIPSISRAIDIYIVNDTVQPSNNLYFIENISTKVNYDQMINHFWEDRKTWGDFDHERFVNIHMDKDVSFRVLNDLKLSLRQVGIYRIQYSTVPKNNAKSPALFKYIGIPDILYPKYDPSFSALLDSAESLDLSKYRLRLPPSALYRNISLRTFNRVEVRIDQEQIYLNNSPIQPEVLKIFLYKLIKKYSQNFVVIFSPSDKITYGRYIEGLDLVNVPYHRIRKEMAVSLDYEPIYSPVNQVISDKIDSRYPKYIVEWTAEEKRVNVLMEKMKAIDKTLRP